MNILGKIKTKLNRIEQISNQVVQVQKALQKILEAIVSLERTLHKILEATGRLESRQLQATDSKSLKDNEFRVFSQWGEDGIIQFLINHIPVKRKLFVEFGVENYTEASTRFLLINNNWAGLVIDGSSNNINNINNINYIKRDPIYWQYNLKAICAFVTKDNINDLIAQNGIQGKIGLLSIDIDGNDYWVWDAINVVDPAIVIVEYNSRFGTEKTVTVPYDEKFIRSQAHYSMIYYGASLKAFNVLAQKKGYSFVGCNSAGNNAFFVRKDLKPDYIPEITVEEGYVAAQYRESRDEHGKLNYLSWEEQEKLLASLPLVEVE